MPAASVNELPLMYTQYCKYYRKFAAITKATMHIKRKSGEQLEVNWAKCKALHFAQLTSSCSPGLRWICTVALWLILLLVVVTELGIH